MRKRSVRYKLLALVSAGLLAGAVGGSYAAFSSSASSSGNTFSAAASFASCTGTSPSWVTGVEHGLASTSGGGLFDFLQAGTADSSVKRSGAYSLRLTSSSGAYASKWAVGSTVVMRFALRFASLPSGNVSALASTYASAGSNLMLGYRASDQKLTLSYGGVSPVASSMTMSAGTWYVIDMKAELGSDPRTGEWRVDGVAQPSVSRAEAAASNYLAILGSATSSDVFTVNVDDIVVSPTAGDYPLGNGRVLGLRPNAVDTHNNPGNFGNETGGAIDSTTWNRLDEDPLTGSTNDGVYQGTASGTSYLGFGFEDTTKSCIRGVSAIFAYLSSGTNSNNGSMRIRDGSTERTVFSGDMSETTFQYKSAVISPASAPWTQTAVNGLIARVGYSTDVSPIPYWESVMLEYETTD